MNEKKKNEMADVLNNCEDIFGNVVTATDLISKAARTALTVITAVRTIFEIPEKAEPFPEEIEPPNKKDVAPKEETPAKKEYTKADVRKFLAGIADQHRSEVKALLTKYGADNLTQLDPKHYAAIMADAEEIANA